MFLFFNGFFNSYFLASIRDCRLQLQLQLQLQLLELIPGDKGLSPEFAILKYYKGHKFLASRILWFMDCGIIFSGHDA